MALVFEDAARIEERIKEWIYHGKNALLVSGARQVGKTWIAKDFAKNQFENNWVYINFEEDAFASYKFSKEEFRNNKKIINKK